MKDKRRNSNRFIFNYMLLSTSIFIFMCLHSSNKWESVKSNFYYNNEIKIKIKYKNCAYISPFIHLSYCKNITNNFEEKRLLDLNSSLSKSGLESVLLKKYKIENGGCWKPENCVAKSFIAILIPYRDREEHLNIFLLNMHPLFIKQQLSYCIYLIEPVKYIKFNRGLLLNIGYIESNNGSNNSWQCHAYHDVDLISENGRTSYHCPDNPTHLSYKLDYKNYKPLYIEYFGGVTIIRKDHFLKANGYSNLYFDWGAEGFVYLKFFFVYKSEFTIVTSLDDDHRRRLIRANLSIVKCETGEFRMLRHGKAVANADRFRILDQAARRFDVEGLNTVEYKLIEKVKEKLYTKFIVNYNETYLLEKYSGLIS